MTLEKPTFLCFSLHLRPTFWPMSDTSHTKIKMEPELVYSVARFACGVRTALDQQNEIAVIREVLITSTVDFMTNNF